MQSCLLPATLSWNRAFALPVWLSVCILAALLIAIGIGAYTLRRRGVEGKWVAGLTGLRLVAWLLLGLILLPPIVTRSSSSRVRPELVVLIDTSASMKQPAEKGTRLEEVIAQVQRSGLAERLRKDFQPRWFRFDDRVAPLQESDLGSLSSETRGTRIADSLTTVIELMRAEDRRLDRILLVSDGIDQDASASAVDTAQRYGVKVDVLAPRETDASLSAATKLVDVQGARRVLLGSETHFRVSLRATKPETGPLVLSVREDGKLISQTPLTLKGDQPETSVILSHRPETTGTKQYAFLLHVKGEAEPISKKIWTAQVVDDRYEILFLEDQWRWEYKYLHRLFEDDPSFRFTALLSRGKTYAQFGSPDRRVNLVGMPQGRGEMEDFDLFFLGDVNPSRWPGPLAGALANLVAVEGKSLVVIAGPHLASWLDQPELHALLPVDLDRGAASPVEGPIDARMRPDAAGSPFFFQLPSDAGQLPPLDRVYPVARKRPGATVLLEAAKHRNSYGPLIVMAEHTVGKGRVLYIGTDTLWKWHTLAAGDGPTPYQIFWQQAFRALTPQRSRQGNANLWLTPSRTTASVGQPITLQAELRSDRIAPGMKIDATAVFADGKVATLLFAPDAAAPNLFKATVLPTVAGPLQISASLTAEGKNIADSKIIVQVDPARAEEEALPVDRSYLANLATSTGGKVIDPDNAETWPEPREMSTDPPMSRASTFDPWNSWWLIVAICVILGTDWILRVRKGLT